MRIIGLFACLIFLSSCGGNVDWKSAAGAFAEGSCRMTLRGC